VSAILELYGGATKEKTMAVSYTTRYLLAKYAKGDTDWDVKINANQDLLEAALLNMDWVKETVSATVDVTADDTYVGDSFALTNTFPADSVVTGIIVKAAAPAGTAGGATKTIEFAIGSVENTDTDLTDAGECDILSRIGPMTAAGKATDFNPEYYNQLTAPFLNFRGKDSDATANAGTVTCVFTVYLKIAELPS